MAAILQLHPDNPQVRTIEQIRDAAKWCGDTPTDTVYAIGCDLNWNPQLNEYDGSYRMISHWRFYVPAV